MPTVAELAALVQIQGADTARSDLRGVQSELQATQQAATAAGAGLVQLGQGGTSAAGDLNAVDRAIMAVTADIGGSITKVLASTQAFGQLGTAARAAATDLNQAGTATQATTKELNAAQPAIMAAAAGFAAAGAGIGAGFVAIGKAGAEFEHAMAQVKAVMSPAEVQAMGGALDALALKMGNSGLGFSAIEAAHAMEEMAKSGRSADQMVTDLPGVLALAAAGQENLGKSAEFAATMLTVFDKEGLTTAKVADVVAGAANATRANVNDVVVAMSQASPVAALLGFTFEETATMMALMSQNGIKASEVGNIMKRDMMDMQPATTKAAEAMRQFGIITADGTNQLVHANGTYKQWSEVIPVLTGALGGLTKVEQEQALQAMFGFRGIQLGAVILKEGVDGWNKMRDAIHEVTAEQVAHARLDSLIGSLKNLSAVAETTAITFAGNLAPSLRPIVEGVTALVQGLATLSPQMQQTLGVLAGLAGAASATTGAILALEFGLKLTGATLVTAAGAVAEIAIPVALVAAAVGVLAVAWINNWGDIQGKAAAASAVITPFLTELAGALKTVSDFASLIALPNLSKWFKDLADTADNPIGQAFGHLGEGAGQAFLLGIVGTLKQVTGFVFLEPVIKQMAAEVARIKAAMPATTAPLKEGADQAGEETAEALAAGLVKKATALDQAWAHLQSGAVGGIKELKKALAAAMTDETDQGDILHAIELSKELATIDEAEKKLEPAIAAAVLSIRNQGDVSRAAALASDHLAASAQSQAAAHAEAKAASEKAKTALELHRAAITAMIGATDAATVQTGQYAQALDQLVNSHLKNIPSDVAAMATALINGGKDTEAARLVAAQFGLTLDEFVDTTKRVGVNYQAMISVLSSSTDPFIIQLGQVQSRMASWVQGELGQLPIEVAKYVQAQLNANNVMGAAQIVAQHYGGDLDDARQHMGLLDDATKQITKSFNPLQIATGLYEQRLQSLVSGALTQLPIQQAAVIQSFLNTGNVVGASHAFADAVGVDYADLTRILNGSTEAKKRLDEALAKPPPLAPLAPTVEGPATRALRQLEANQKAQQDEKAASLEFARLTGQNIAAAPGSSAWTQPSPDAAAFPQQVELNQRRAAQQARAYGRVADRGFADGVTEDSPLSAAAVTTMVTGAVAAAATALPAATGAGTQMATAVEHGLVAAQPAVEAAGTDLGLAALAGVSAGAAQSQDELATAITATTTGGLAEAVTQWPGAGLEGQALADFVVTGVTDGIYADAAQIGAALIAAAQDGLATSAGSAKTETADEAAAVGAGLVDSLADGVVTHAAVLDGALVTISESALPSAEHVLTTGGTTLAESMTQALADGLYAGEGQIGDAQAAAIAIAAANAQDSAATAGETLGEGLGGGIAQGVANVITDMANGIIDAATAAIDFAKDKLGIHSPSQVTADEIGAPMMEGVAVGINAEAGRASQALTGALDGMMSGAYQGLTVWQRGLNAYINSRDYETSAVMGHPSPFGPSRPATTDMYGTPLTPHYDDPTTDWFTGNYGGTGAPTQPNWWVGSGKSQNYYDNPFLQGNADTAQAQRDYAAYQSGGDAAASASVKAALSGQITGPYAEAIKDLAAQAKKTSAETTTATRSVKDLGREADRTAPPVREVSDVLGDLGQSASNAVANTTLFSGGIKDLAKQLGQNASVYDAYSNVGLQRNTAAFNAMAVTATAPTTGGQGALPTSADPTQAGYYGAAYAQPVVSFTPEQMQQILAGAIAGGTVPDPNLENVARFAEGGVADRPTLGIFGEHGPEALVPLDQYRGGIGAPITVNITYRPAFGASSEIERRQAARQLTDLIVPNLRRKGLQ